MEFIVRRFRRVSDVYSAIQYKLIGDLELGTLKKYIYSEKWTKRTEKEKTYKCSFCGEYLHEHGMYVGNNDSERVVCPSDYLMFNSEGKFFHVTEKDLELHYQYIGKDIVEERKLRTLTKALNKIKKAIKNLTSICI